MERRIEIRKEIRGASEGPTRRERRVKVITTAGAGTWSQKACSCSLEGAEVTCDHCEECTCILGDEGLRACLCGCEGAEISEEDENGHTVIKIRVPKVVRSEGGEDVLVKAAGVSDAVENLSDQVAALARAARAQGATWQQIGDALGISKQAAWERFSGEE